MPELPEVETTVRDLSQSGILGQRIISAEVHWPRTVGHPSAQQFCAQIIGTAIESIHRRAKYILCHLSNQQTLIIHLRMTGHFSIHTVDDPLSIHEHVVINFANGQQLRFHDTRKFGRWILTDTPQTFLGHLGPEPLEESFTAESLYRQLKSKSRQLKPLLLDQTFIAGLGNIYVDEALWEARLHPLALSSELSELEAALLHQAIRKVLKQGIENLGTTLGHTQINFYSFNRSGKNVTELQVFRRTGQPCPRCHTAIERLVVGQRSTHICPVCQRLSLVK